MGGAALHLNLFEQRTGKQGIALENSADFRPDRGLPLWESVIGLFSHSSRMGS
jgi:hypothetical protein